MPKEQQNIRERVNLKEPRKYKVIFHNDDITTMEFVTMVLTQVFFLSEERAVRLMLQVHYNGSATVGVYTYDIASSKANKATAMAREEGYPLTITVEPEENE